MNFFLNQQPVMQKPVTTYTSSYFVKSFQEEKMDRLYQVFMVDGTLRNNPEVLVKNVIAQTEEDAKLIAGFSLDGKDLDYITVLVQPIGPVKLKPRPTEIKSIE